MKEIICIQIGNCGNGIGRQVRKYYLESLKHFAGGLSYGVTFYNRKPHLAFWEIICAEHGLSQNGSYVGKAKVQLENVNVYFTELRGLQYSPRAVMIDLDQNSLEAIRSSPFGEIFKEKNFLYGSEGAGNNWAKGHLSEGVQLCDRSLDVIRREVEDCDCFHGFQITHCIGGGTGGGLGSLLVDKLMEEYPTRITSTFSVIPSQTVTSCVVEPYNALLTLSHLIESTHGVYCIDNEALYSITSNVLKLDQASYRDLNYIITTAMSGITSCMRFPGPANTSFRKIAVNMSPFPRLHFFVLGLAPLLSQNTKAYRQLSVADITNDLFDHKNLFVACDSKKGKFLSLACVFRGGIPTREIDKQMYNIRNRHSSSFVEWIPDNIKTALCSVPPPGITKNATLIGNTTSIQKVFNRVRDQYLNMIRKKVFLHWYTAEGMDEIEFHAAEANLKDLIQEYHENEIAKPLMTS